MNWKVFYYVLRVRFVIFFYIINAINEWKKPGGQCGGSLADYENTASATVHTIYRNVRIDSRGHVAQRPLPLLLAASPSNPQTAPKSNLPPPPSTDESTPVTPNSIRRQCHSGKPRWLPRQHFEFSKIVSMYPPAIYTQAILITLFTCNSAATSDVLL